MPNDKSLPKPETAAQQETGGDCVSRLVRVFIAPEDDKPWETIGRALCVAAAWPDPFTREESTPQAVWNWIDARIGGRANRKWEAAPRGKNFIANSALSD